MSGLDGDPARPAAPSAEETALIRQRQRERARVMAWLLGGFVVLIFAISVVKIGLGYG
jgi:hypothetical protein